MKPYLIILISLLTTYTVYGQHKLRYQIEKIEYDSWPGDWEGCSFTFTINADRTIEYKADSTYCKPMIGKYQTNNIKFPKLKDRYGYGIDCGGSVLTITYNNGKAKKITVVCGGDPKALEDILHLLYGLKDTEHWK